MPDRTAIVGVGYTPIVRYTKQALGRLALYAALEAIADAGLTAADIDGYAGCPRNSNVADGVDEVSAGWMIAALGMKEPNWVMDVHGLPTDALLAASQALQSGACRYVVLVGTTYNAAGSGVAGFRGRQHDHSWAAGEEQFEMPYGLHGPGGSHALRLQRYFHEYGATREELYSVVATQRRYVEQNPYAYWHGRDLVLDEYLYSRWLYEPLCLFDTVIPTTGAGALVITTEDRTRDLAHRPAYIAGFANTRQPPDRIFHSSGIGRSDVGVAQLFDGFSPFVWYWLEHLGFCGEGEAHAFTAAGSTALGGDLPVNTFGGELGEGPLRGLGHLREAAMQVMGRAGDRQVKGVDHCVVAVGQPTPDFFRYLVMLSKAKKNPSGISRRGYQGLSYSGRSSHDQKCRPSVRFGGRLLRSEIPDLSMLRA